MQKLQDHHTSTTREHYLTIFTLGIHQCTTWTHSTFGTKSISERHFFLPETLQINNANWNYESVTCLGSRRNMSGSFRMSENGSFSAFPKSTYVTLTVSSLLTPMRQIRTLQIRSCVVTLWMSHTQVERTIEQTTETKLLVLKTIAKSAVLTPDAPSSV